MSEYEVYVRIKKVSKQWWHVTGTLREALATKQSDEDIYLCSMRIKKKIIEGDKHHEFG